MTIHLESSHKALTLPGLIMWGDYPYRISTHVALYKACRNSFQASLSIGTSKPVNDKLLTRPHGKNYALVDGHTFMVKSHNKMKSHLQFAICSWKSCSVGLLPGSKTRWWNNGVLATWTAEKGCGVRRWVRPRASWGPGSTEAREAGEFAALS